MANNNLQATHENIHSGLSGLSNDEKWRDMLNFRSSEQRTTVVSPKYLLLRGEKWGLHSILPALSGHNLAIGTCKSIGFVGSDSPCTYPLWRLEQRYLGERSSRGEQSQRLAIQGNFTGDKKVKLKVHFVEGKFVLEEPYVEPEFEVILPPEIQEDQTYTITGTITNAVDGAIVTGASVSFSAFGATAYGTISSPTGTYEIQDMNAGVYTLTVSHPDWRTNRSDVIISGNAVIDRVLHPKPDIDILMATATSAGGGLECAMGPVVKTMVVEPPYELLPGTYELRVTFTTADALFHLGCFYQLLLTFTPETATITWVTEHTGILGGDPWVIADSGKSLRFNVEDSGGTGPATFGQCGSGVNTDIQTGSAVATITVTEETMMGFDFDGLAELHDTGYENISFYLKSINP